VSKHAAWCRNHFDGLADGALWLVPRSGLVFQRDKDRLVWVATIPVNDGPNIYQDFQTHQRQFRSAGIDVGCYDDPKEFPNFEGVEQYFGGRMTRTTKFNHRGRRCLACHQQLPDRDFPSPKALSCNLCTPVSEGLTTSVLGSSHMLGEHGGNPSMVDWVHNAPKDFSGGLSQPTSIYDKAKPHRFGPGYDDIRTQRPARPDHDVARALLNRAKAATPSLDWKKDDDRPLIDILHEATFTYPRGTAIVGDAYAFRTVLRKAHCFTLDAVTSALVADFSLAIKADLESARRLAIPPFDVTWIDLDNRARLKRVAELGIPLTKTASGETAAGPPVERVGWLIQPCRDIPGGYYATYCTVIEEGVIIAPLSYFWSTAEPNPHPVGDGHLAHEYALGVMDSNVNPSDAYVAPLPQANFELTGKKASAYVHEMMSEIAGELRHIWGFLIALGAGQLGIEVKTTPQPKHTDIRTMPNGKPLLPLEHKILHLHLAKRHDPDRVIKRMITHHKHRWHEVRGHFRTLKNADGTVKKRVPVKPHERGDERLGRIEKTYRVER
jgi:hypothetical protein